MGLMVKSRLKQLHYRFDSQVEAKPLAVLRIASGFAVWKIGRQNSDGLCFLASTSELVGLFCAVFWNIIFTRPTKQWRVEWAIPTSIGA
jgi:hypothetical protein